MDDREVALGQLLVAGADPAELLPPADAPLDAGTPPGRRPVADVGPAELGPPAGRPPAARHHAPDAAAAPVRAGLGEVVALVAGQPLRPGPRPAPRPGHGHRPQRRVQPADVRRRPGGAGEPPRPPAAARRDPVELRAGPAAAAPQGLVARLAAPFLAAPAAARLARTLVESAPNSDQSISPSRSAAPWRRRRMRTQAPSFCQRRKRSHTVCQGPNRS